MVKHSIYPPPFAWDVLSLGLAIFLSCSGISIVRTDNYKVEYQQFKLQVGEAISEVRKVSDTLERTAESSAIAPHEKYRIQQLTEKSTAVLEQVESDIEQSTEKLIFLEEEL